MVKLERFVGFVSSLISIFAFVYSLYFVSGSHPLPFQIGISPIALRVLGLLVLLTIVAASGAFWMVRCSRLGAGTPMVFAVIIAGVSAWTAAFVSRVLFTGEAPRFSFLSPPTPAFFLFLYSAMGCWAVYGVACNYFLEAFSRDHVKTEHVMGVFREYDRTVSVLKVSKSGLLQLAMLLAIVMFIATYAT